MADFTREEVLEIAHKLENSDLEGLDLSNAYLRETNLTGSDLSRAKYDPATRFPEGFDPEARDMELLK